MRLPKSQQMAQALLKKHPKLKSDFGFIYTSAPITVEKVPLEKTPLVLDALWGKFVATGDSAPVERIISTLSWIDVQDQTNRRFVGIAAKLSLTYQAAQHKRVLSICEDAAKTTSPEVSVKLSEVIDNAKKELKIKHNPAVNTDAAR